MQSIRPVILCGGSGTRLWPLSRELHPKQFMELAQGTLFATTLKRMANIPHLGRPIVVCNAEHRFFAASIMQELGIRGEIILEPQGRNTAPAIALAALSALTTHHEDGGDAPEPLLLVLPSDHELEPPEALSRAVALAAPFAELGEMLTFGVKASRPETGFGYLRQGPERVSRVHKVAAFVEKPDAAKAEEFVKSGEYAWNSGIFLFKASVYLQELKRLAPEVKDACAAAWTERARDLDFIRVNAEIFATSPAVSIDYAVMEHTALVSMVSLEAKWSDLGSWQAFYEATAHDEKANAIVGDVLTHDVEGCYLHSSGRLLGALGVKDLAVVETADAVLVMDLRRSQEVKTLFETLKQTGREEACAHVKVYRPWGHYSLLSKGERFQVKSIVVKPGARLSLQMHHHRAEHWVVVSGTAKVTAGEKIFYLSENESTYIPVGLRHSLENPGKIPLEIIEVQSGSYLGEDDIIRLEDSYGRE